MALWDTVKNIFTGGGSEDIDEGYKKAQEMMYPYQQGGAQDYQNYRNYVSQTGKNLSPFQDAGNWQATQINQSPTNYYNQIMGHYDESPQAKYEQEQAMHAATAGGSASGMIGSGAFQKSLQENAGNISARDQQRYFNNIMGTNQMQMGYLDDVRNRQNSYNQMQQYLTNLGYGSATGMGQNSINRGIASANMGRQTVGDIVSMAGYGSGGLFGQSGQGQSSGGLDPATMAKLAKFAAMLG